MKTALLTCIIFLATFATVDAQCPNCQPQQPTANANNGPQYVWVRQRRGLFGWRCRWVLMPLQPATPVNVIGIVPR